jgi:hypothetical protein
VQGLTDPLPAINSALRAYWKESAGAFLPDVLHAFAGRRTGILAGSASAHGADPLSVVATRESIWEFGTAA